MTKNLFEMWLLWGLSARLSLASSSISLVLEFPQESKRAFICLW